MRYLEHSAISTKAPNPLRQATLNSSLYLGNFRKINSMGERVHHDFTPHPNKKGSKPRSCPMISYIQETTEHKFFLLYIKNQVKRVISLQLT